MSKERVFYLDFIRAFATVVIVLCHFNALFIYNCNNPQSAVITLYVGNIYIGAFGVSLFLIITGAAMMYVYGEKEKIDLKHFYKRRFVTIYPTFWICYFLIFLLNFYENKGLPDIPKKNIIFSVIGLDGYLSNFGIRTFYYVGEWFLGFILLIYIIIPFIIFLAKRKVWVLIAATTVLYVFSLIFFKDKSYVGLLITTRLPEIVFGMIFIKYIKNVKWYCALGAFIIIVLNHLIKPSFIDQNIQVTYIGILSFVVLVFLSKHLSNFFTRNLCSVICKYSYSCFIIHHYIIYRFTTTFDLQSITPFYSWLLFMFCGVMVIVASFLLYQINDKVMSLFSKNKA